MPPIVRPRKPNPVREALPEGVRRVVDFIWPEDDPFAGLSPSPLISIYKNAAGIPDAALRKAGTQAFLDSGQRLAENVPGQVKPDNLMDAVRQFAHRYPRVAAHMRMESTVAKPEGFSYSPSGRASAYARTQSGKVKSPIDIGITDDMVRSMENDPTTIHDAIAHEGAHVAQNLGNSRFSELYDKLHKLAGYKYNPLEDSANIAGDRAVEVTKGMSRRELSRPNKTYESIQYILDDPRENMWKRQLIGGTERLKWDPADFLVSHTPPTPTAQKAGIGWWDIPKDIEQRTQIAADLQDLLKQRTLK